MTISLDDLTVNIEHLEPLQLLRDWAWLIDVNLQPVMVTASGDMFLQNSATGSIHLLDVGAGELLDIVQDLEHFHALLENEKFVRDFLAEAMIVDLRKQGLTLAKGEIYSLKRPLVLGGQYEFANIEAVDVQVHFSTSGQVHQKVRNLSADSRDAQISSD